MKSTPETTLRDRVLHAGTWVLGGHVLGQVIRLGSNLLLTRLLVPESFGLMGIVTVLMIGFALFSELGIVQNIVRSARGDDPTFLLGGLVDAQMTLPALATGLLLGLAFHCATPSRQALRTMFLAS